MEIRSLNHVALLIKDVDRSRQFYSKILKMEEVSRPHTFDFPGAWFRKGSAEIHLIGEAEVGRAAQMQGQYRADERARGYAVHIAFEVDDLDIVQHYLRDHDVPILGGPQPRGDGVTQLYICDPDGYLIELFERSVYD